MNDMKLASVLDYADYVYDVEDLMKLKRIFHNIDSRTARRKTNKTKKIFNRNR